MWLKKFNFEVTIVNNSHDAIEMLKNRHFSHISLDYDLDYGNGGKADNSCPVAAHIKDNNIDSIIFIHSGAAENAVKLGKILGYEADVDKLYRDPLIADKCIWIDKHKWSKEIQYYI